MSGGKVCADLSQIKSVTYIWNDKTWRSFGLGKKILLPLLVVRLELKNLKAFIRLKLLP